MCDDVPRFIIIAAFLLDLNNSKHKPTREKYNQNQKINCTNKKWSASFFFLLNISLLLDLSTNEQYLHSTEMWWPKLYTNLDRILLPIFSHVAKYTIIYNKLGGNEMLFEKSYIFCVSITFLLLCFRFGLFTDEFSAPQSTEFQFKPKWETNWIIFTVVVYLAYSTGTCNNNNYWKCVSGLMNSKLVALF